MKQRKPMCEKWKFSFTGDITLARGMDQVLNYSVAPILYEEAVKNAREYVWLAWERLKREHRADPSFLRGDLILSEMSFGSPRDLWVSNLETSLTTFSKPYPKGINYRTHPKNVYFLLQLQKKIGCPLVLSLANNHVMDWGTEGLLQTLSTLQHNKLACIGAGKNLLEATRPFVLSRRGQRCLVFACGHPSAGIPLEWSATPQNPGIFLIPELRFYVPVFERLCKLYCKSTDIKILMTHWGPNWQPKIDPEFQKCCRDLIDQVGFRIVVNSSPHHVMKVETYHGGIICYSPGDFLSDYYGIEDPLHLPFHPDVGSVVSTFLDCRHIRIGVQKFQRIGFQLHPLLLAEEVAC